MFREMRRKERELPEGEARKILKCASSGVLALSGDEGYPYAVPVSFALCDNALYIHGTLTGHKYDAVSRCDKASFCVIDKDDVVPAELSTNYRSVICFGRIALVTDEEEKKKGILNICEKYAPDNGDTRDGEIKATWKGLGVFRFDIEHLTGKAR